jgi:hypothetical protein
MATGRNTLASGDNSTAMGNMTKAYGHASTTMGVKSVAYGTASLANGDSSVANGEYSTASGYRCIATGDGAVALGFACVASGVRSFATGDDCKATADYAIALGSNSQANANYSVAIGKHAAVNGMSGSFVFGDASASTFAPTASTATNQMTMRFAGGYRLFTNSTATVGAQIAAGGNSWSTISDIRKKENFSPVNGEEFLKKISKFSLTSWNYKGQDAKTFRHYGPMAQDFYAAFGKDSYGTIGNDTTINQADMEGVSFVAIQALVKRTEEIKVLKEEIAALKTQLAAHKTENLELKAELVEQNKGMKNDIEQIKAEMLRGKLGVK